MAEDNNCFVISSDSSDCKVEIKSSEFIGVEIHAGTGINEGRFFVYGMIKGGATPIGGSYNSMFHATIVADKFKKYISSEEISQHDFRFPLPYEVFEEEK